MADSSRSGWAPWLMLGPGLAVAATGIGAGDVVAAAVAGARYEMAILWAALVGALVKYGLNEGLARWQLATGTTLLEGWALHLHRGVLYAFLVYLVLWTFIVAGALMAACGLAFFALTGLAVPIGGAAHAVGALALVLIGRYALFERLMKVFIALMFITVLGSALLVAPDLAAIGRGLLIPRVPDGSGPFLLGVIGGVGGSVTLLSYSYWIQERGWDTPGHARTARIDLRIAYVLTGVFGVAIMVLAAGVSADAITGTGMALRLAERIEVATGYLGKMLFLLGFWGAVFSSMLGVWQGVPYIFADLLRLLRRQPAQPASALTQSRSYRGYLVGMAVLPMVLLLADRPVWIVLIYSIAGAFFMPLLAATLLWLNNRAALVGAERNRWWTNGLLLAALLVFGYLLMQEVGG